jgi:hypothetical protein
MCSVLVNHVFQASSIFASRVLGVDPRMLFKSFFHGITFFRKLYSRNILERKEIRTKFVLLLFSELM